MFDLFNFAYLDPSTGSIVIQSLIGIVAGVTVFGRNAIHQVAGKAKRLFTKNEASGAKSEAKIEQQ
jgi:hypothetical protein